jgi:hypothetical protein
MKAPHLSFFLLFILYSCNQKPKHPQADLINQDATTAMTDQSIALYADSLDANPKSLEKQISLVYQIGDVSMYAEQYSYNEEPVMYIENISNEGISSRIRKYYFKNDSLILVKENNKLSKGNGEIYEDKRTYIRNNIAFKRENRSSVSAASLKKKPYTTQQTSGTDKNDKEFAENIAQLKDAINGVNKFEMLFDNIIPGPDESHILLKSKLPNGYSANVVVNDNDQFIDSLISRPSLFKDKRPNIKWEIRDKEAIYVPVASSVTSAKGLNR